MKMKQYAKYKPSGVDWIGEIPEHWETKRLKYVASVQPSNVDKKTIEGELPVLLCNYMDVYKNEFIDSSINFMEATATEAEIAKFKIKKGDVLVTKDSETPDDIANPAFVKDDFNNIICAYHLTQIRPNRDELIGKYLFRLFQEHRYKGQFEVAANGVTRFGLSVFAFLDAFVPLPHPDEQTAIANYLDDKTSLIDTLVANKQKLIELLKEERTAIINQAVTKGINPKAKLKPSGIDWLGDIPEHWEVKKLKHIKAQTPNSFVDGPFGSNLKSIHFIENGEVYVVESGFITSGSFVMKKFKTISNDHFETIKRSACKGGDIIIAKIGANYGMSGILPELDKEAVVSGNSLKLTVSENHDRKFIHFSLSNLKARGAFDLIVNSTAQPALSLGELNDMSLAVPPLEEQSFIVSHIETATQKIDATISKIEKEIGLLQEYRTALISEAVTGKIKVI